MKIKYLSLMILAIICSCSSTEPQPKFIGIDVPNGIIVVTEEQQIFIERVKEIDKNMMKNDIINLLGKPKEVKVDKIFYFLEEGTEGGHYISANISFYKDKVIKGQVHFGHISKTPVEFNPWE